MPADKTLIKPRLPRGLADRGAGAIRATEAMVAKIRAVYERYGFEPVETPLVEYTDALGKFLPDQDRPNEGVFSFQDDDEQWLSLRYDLTAPLARYVAENFDALPKPYRSYRAGWVFRNEKPGPGRFRQFMQFDADTVGAASPAADAEMCMMVADTLEALGIPRGQYVIKVNNRKVLDGVMEAIGLGGDENAGRRLTVLRAIDKLDRLGLEGVAAAARRGPQGRERRLHQGRRARRRADRPIVRFSVRLRRAIAEMRRLETLGCDAERRGAIATSSTRSQWSMSASSRASTRALAELEHDRRARRGGRLRHDRDQHRPLRRPRPRILHRRRSSRPSSCSRSPTRRASRCAFGSVGGGGRYDGLVGRFTRRARAGDRLLDRRLAPAGGADGARQDRRRATPAARWS